MQMKFKNGLAQLTSEFQEHQQKLVKVSLDDVVLDKQPSDFGLFYTFRNHQLEDVCRKTKNFHLSKQNYKRLYFGHEQS